MVENWADGYVDYRIRNKILIGHSKEFMKWVNSNIPYEPSLLFSWSEKIVRFFVKL